MKKLTTQNVTEAVRERFALCTEPRLRKVMSALIGHLHDFARDVKLTPTEWTAAIQFLTDTGQTCDDKRQEFILLSDTLGLSALVDLLANSDKSEKATESSLLGPFF